MTKFQASIFTVLLFASASVQALQLTDTTEVHGFASQSYVLSPDNPYAGEQSNKGSFNFREFGLNGSWEINDQLRATGQVLSRKLDKTDDGNLRVDFLLLDYLAHSDADATFGVRLGRVKSPLGLYNATRDIPSARPGVSVPNAIYFESFRDSIISVDGLNLYGSLFSKAGVLNWEAYTGNSQLESNVMEHYIYGTTVQGKFEDIDLSGLKLDFSPANMPNFNTGISFLKAKFSLQDPQSALQAQQAINSSDSVTAAATLAATPVENGGLGLDPNSAEFMQYVGLAAQQEAQANYPSYITGTDLEALFVVLSMQYAYQDWLISAEYLNIYSDLNLSIAGQSRAVDTTTEGYYLQGEWFFKQNMSALIRYEELYLNKNSRDGASSATVNNAYRGYGKGLTVGLGWAVTPNWHLNAQASFNRGTVWLPVYDGIDQMPLEKDWVTYILQASYQF